MGGKCPHRSVKKRRYSHKQFRRGKFLVKGDDAVYDELNKPEEQRNALPVDEDLPGMGQYYCMHCEKQKIEQQRKNLPIAEVERRLMEEVRNNDTLIIVGETGSGKTTLRD